VPAVSVTTSYNNAIREVDILNNYLIQSLTLDAKYQYFVGEVIMLRLFSVLESTIGEVALKLACGANYRNAAPPVILIACSSVGDATAKMISAGRAQPLTYLSWTTKKSIKNCIKFVLDTNDHFYLQIRNYNVLLNEMRVVRNHIAHRNSDTNRKFKQEMTRIYGANPRLNMGAFLVSTTRHPMSNLRRYVQTTRIILNDITSG
jgi:hypothetical protein